MSLRTHQRKSYWRDPTKEASRPSSRRAERPTDEDFPIHRTSFARRLACQMKSSLLEKCTLCWQWPGTRMPTFVPSLLSLEPSPN